MKAAVLYGINNLKLEDIEKPRIESNEVLIRVHTTQLSVSELNIFKGIRRARKFPIVPGHEYSGTIAEIGKEVEEINIGDKVVAEDSVSCGRCEFCKRGEFSFCQNRKVFGIDINGAFEEYIVVPAYLVHKLPNNISYEEGAFVEPLSTCLYVLKKCGVSFEDFIVILGQGPVGLIILQAAKMCGFNQIITTDVLDYRLDYSQRLGADVTINVKEEDPVKKSLEITKGIGANVVIEAAGSPTTFQQAMKIVKPRGTIVQVGHIYSTVELDPLSLYYREIKIISGRGHLFKPAINLLRYSKIDVKTLITHRLSISEIIEAYKILDKRLETKAIEVQIRIK